MSADQRATPLGGEPSDERPRPTFPVLEVLDLVEPGSSCRPDGTCD